MCTNLPIEKSGLSQLLLA